MLRDLLQLADQKTVVRPDDMAKRLGVSERVLAVMITDLEQRGYLRIANSAASCEPSCDHCALKPTCGPAGMRLWQVTEQGYRALGKEPAGHPPAGESHQQCCS